MSNRPYIAHSHDSAEPHGLAMHLETVAALAKESADKFGAGSWAEAAGILHDLGKYSDAFQRRVRGDPTPVDHSTAGAQVAARHYSGAVGKLLAGIVAGHHGGLPNGTQDLTQEGLRTDLGRRLEKDIPEASAWRDEITLPALTPPPLKPHPTAGSDRIGLQLAHVARMVFSALIDADRVDTEAYYAAIEGWPNARGEWQPIGVLRDQLAVHMVQKSQEAAQTPINVIRGKTSCGQPWRLLRAHLACTP